uniref:Hedgehog/Intein (Hint) domain-containing protein n=1 Tax=viral metagenome TaxID=1070528 RepID=A0A6C0CSZ9_9ZZZZ
MPTFFDNSRLLFVIIGFITITLTMFLFVSINEIKANWANYRCNPIYMPLSDNIEKDFVFCIQNMQTNYMGYLLQPLTYITSTLSTLADQFVGNIDAIRTVLSNVRTFATTILTGIFSVLMSIVVSYQKLIISIKDLAGKLIGSMVSLMYIMYGSMMTIQSSWNGPPGKMVRALCFHPETKIKLKNGDVRVMKDLDLGDVLENDVKILSIMKMNNLENQNKLYKFEKMGVDGDDIYVTGKHMVFSEEKQKFIYVDEDPRAVEQNEVSSDWFSCLITSNHHIPIGKLIFWDWEDDDIAY